MKLRYFASKFLTLLSLAIILSISVSNAVAQETPLTLTQLLTALQSTSSDLNMSQKNSFVTQRVNQRGVTFTLTEQLTTELKNAGASAQLIAAIGANDPEANQASTEKSSSKTADVAFSSLWVEKGITRDGREGMVIHTELAAYNLNDVPLQLTVRFQDSSNQTLTSTNQNYANKSGELALFRNITPGSDAVAYKDLAVFVPYGELQLEPGIHKLRINADVIFADGKLLKHLTLNEVTLSIAKPSGNAPRASFEKMWVDYGVTENGKPGMRIHTKLKAYNLKATPCWLTIMFETQDGERLTAKNTFYADRKGGVTVYLELTPGSSVSLYNDISVFMPYDELNLKTGNYELQMRADLTYPDGGLIQHLNYYPFNFQQP